MQRVATKFVPRLITDDQKANRVRVCQELLDRSDEDENFLSRIIAGDELWVYGYDIETKVQSSQWVGQTSPRPKKARQVQSNVKLMPTIFLMVRVLFTTSTFLKAPRSTRFTTLY